MAILRITKHGEAVLKKVSAAVDYDAMKKDLPKLLKDMWATMHSVRGVGLAAPQIGLNIRLSVIDVRPEGKPQPLVLINPEIVSLGGTITDEEGCLSLPGLYAKIKRASRAKIRAFDADNQPYEMEGAGLLARAFQHETDHLDGKLFIDHLTFVDKLKIMPILKDLRKNWS